MKRVLPLLAILTCSPALAGNFGVYDARSQAMGGASVAVGSVDLAAGHNPALLGLYDEGEDKSLNGRVQAPYVVGNLSQVAIESIELLQDELDIAMSDAIETYNANPNATNAGLASIAASDLEGGLESIANKDISVSAFAPLIAIAEPSKRGGGGFYLGSRIEAGGRTYVPDEDIDLARRYVEALDNVAEGGYWMDVHPELFDTEEGYTDFAPPPLGDPFEDIDSNADLRGLIINEVAVAGALGFDMEGMRVSVGVTPKAMQIHVFDESREFSSEDFEVEADTKPYLMFNADIGVAVDFDSGFRFAYVSKDIFRRSFDTGTGVTVELNTKHRMGLAYIQPKWQVGMDYDLQTNTPLAVEKTGQFLAFGGEYAVFEQLYLRAGYRHDINGDIAGLFSVGVGSSWRRMFFNFSYATSSEEKAAGLQLGFAF